MRLKCSCSHCATHLEFDSDNIGTVISCPACNRPTKLSLSGEPPTETAAAPSARRSGPEPSAGSPAAMLQAVRAATCYPFLRGFITVLQIIFFVLAGLQVVAGIVSVLALRAAVGTIPNTSLMALPAFGPLIISLIAAAFTVLGAFVIKHCLLLVVDIADCQIQQVSRRS